MSWLQACLSSVGPSRGHYSPSETKRTNSTPIPTTLDPGLVLAKTQLAHAHPRRLRQPSLYPLQGMKLWLADTESHGGEIVYLGSL